MLRIRILNIFSLDCSNLGLMKPYIQVYNKLSYIWGCQSEMAMWGTQCDHWKGDIEGSRCEECAVAITLSNWAGGTVDPEGILASGGWRGAPHCAGRPGSGLIRFL